MEKVPRKASGDGQHLLSDGIIGQRCHTAKAILAAARVRQIKDIEGVKGHRQVVGHPVVLLSGWYTAGHFSVVSHSTAQLVEKV
jgi:hypothetical protein